MTTRPNLKNAPIIEAVLDIRVIPDDGVKSTSFKDFHSKISKRFPIYEQTFQIQGQLQVGVATPSEIKEHKTECARFKSVNSDFISLIQYSGMNLSKVKPYSNWDNLRDNAKEVWLSYKEHFKPKGISRIALRYINKLDLPFDSKIEDIFKTYPEISHLLPQELAAYRLQLVLPSKDKKSIAIVNQILDPNAAREDEQMVGIVFDIDAYQNVNLDINSNEVWDRFETLHSYKNDIFFESLTESARKKYL